MDAFKFAFMGAAQARHDRLVLLGDLTFIHLGTKKGIDIRDQDFLEADLATRTIDLTTLAGYRKSLNQGCARRPYGRRSRQLPEDVASTRGSQEKRGGRRFTNLVFDPLLGARIQLAVRSAAIWAFRYTATSEASELHQT